MRKIFITAGHRGEGTGASGIIDEGAEAILLRDSIAKELAQRGCTVLTDRDRDDLGKVIRKINAGAAPTDICVDIHFNASGGAAHGTEVLHRMRPTDTEIQLAEDMLHATTATLGTKNRGVKRESAGQHSRLAMLSGVRCNSVLVEVCFCDNADDCSKYTAGRDALIKAYADVLERHAKA